jgi:glycerophosphoryl diester phosphodiesterase
MAGSPTPGVAAGLPALIGHRGAAAHAPENTLASIRKAHELGARWVEFDVKLTADGVPILMHDDRLERTTDGRGRVRDWAWERILTLDAGGWFSPSFVGEHVPRLEDALRLCADLGLGINVEIKPCRGRAAETTEAALGVLRRHWPGDLPVPLVSSFEHPCLELARALAPELPRGYLCGRLPRHWQLEVDRYGCATVNLDHRWIDRRRLGLLRAAQVPVLLYTVNDPARARDLVAAGATAVFSDRVADVLAALSTSKSPGQAGADTSLATGRGPQ